MRDKGYEEEGLRESGWEWRGSVKGRECGREMM